MEWNVIAAAILAWVGQFVKARKDIPTWITQAAIGALAFVLYAIGNLPVGVSGLEGWAEWVRLGIGWALAALGGSSLAAGVKLAPRTDSQ